MHLVVGTLEVEEKNLAYAPCAASAPVCTAAVPESLVADEDIVLGLRHVSDVDLLYIDLPVSVAHTVVADHVEPKGKGMAHT